MTTTTDILRRDINLLRLLTKSLQRAIQWFSDGTKIGDVGDYVEINFGAGLTTTSSSVANKKRLTVAATGGGGSVNSVTAADGTITIGGTSSDPTVAVTPGTFDAAGAAATAQSNAESYADTVGAAAVATAEAYADTGDALALKKASDLSDLHSASTARTNLGLGTAATHDVPASGNDRRRRSCWEATRDCRAAPASRLLTRRLAR